ncbi:maleylacetoacetate isomerase [Hyphomonas pacifica]|uniref:Uncharacterized protein n=1 Tax=Hyphomonas pacifica TaxID=1280941 RepID=A0A062U2B8_9PROT|nr:maleylacetoacetate isomerase [Hyphomonas pacifica]KCZ50749.1 hypothetical protein HY2_02535 [Hyphomonas pacifica]RAN34454.1 hypothetical protein HY3_10805 [Hyphomonas pacifica]RAN34967.1 hypothetical protein HY11_02935 [Hyphomonas pacifica]
MSIRVYDYWRSSASYRLRIALNLKQADYETVQVNIAPGADEQFGEDYRKANPQMRVPAIEVDGRVCGQSMAIIEWLDETLPGPSLFPEDAWTRLQARAFADTIACDIHPLNNLSVLKELRQTYGAEEAAITGWYQDWIRRGFDALEEIARSLPEAGYLFGDAPGIAEITLVPQLYNARRYDMDLSAYSILLEIERRCDTLEAFRKSRPNAPDA